MFRDLGWGQRFDAGLVAGQLAVRPVVPLPAGHRDQAALDRLDRLGQQIDKLHQLPFDGGGVRGGALRDEKRPADADEGQAAQPARYQVGNLLGDDGLAGGAQVGEDDQDRACRDARPSHGPAHPAQELDGRWLGLPLVIGHDQHARAWRAAMDPGNHGLRGLAPAGRRGTDVPGCTGVRLLTADTNTPIVGRDEKRLLAAQMLRRHRRRSGPRRSGKAEAQCNRPSYASAGVATTPRKASTCPESGQAIPARHER